MIFKLFKKKIKYDQWRNPLCHCRTSMMEIKRFEQRGIVKVAYWCSRFDCDHSIVLTEEKK